VVPEKDGGGSKIDLTLHSVAIVIPAGFTSKFLKKLVGFFLWLTKPPMDPKIFEGDWDNALVFLKDRRAAYLAGELTLKPPKDIYGTAAAASEAAEASSFVGEDNASNEVAVGNGEKETALATAANPAGAAGGGARVSSADKSSNSNSSSSSRSRSNGSNGAKQGGDTSSSGRAPPPARRNTWSKAILRSVSFSSNNKTRKSPFAPPRGKGAPPPAVPAWWAVRDGYEGGK